MDDASVTFAAAVAGTVPVEPGRAVARRVMDASGASVVVLAVAAGAGMAEHRTPHPLLVQALDGVVTVTVGDVAHDLRPGDLLHIPAAIPHAVHADADSHLCLVLLPRSA